MKNAPKLHSELAAAGIPITGCDDEGRVHFRPEATTSQRSQAESIVAAHDPGPTREQHLRRAGLDLPILIAALAVRMSTDWLTVPPAAKVRVQGVIDAAASRVAAKFS